jgi:class 3 adenylate cyclase
MTTGLTVPEAMSAIGVTVIALIILRGPYMSDIINFYLSQSNLEAQRRNIELSIELSDRIKFFIPRKIANRMDRLLSSNDTSVVSAVYEVLKPKKQDIACLFSDIRGFTEASRELDSFVKETAIPNMKLCTEAIDRNGGIPRKIGDLIFGYFDEASLRRNVIEALAAGLEIAKINARMNVDSAHSINRYILISSGEAIVGNIGGLDSSVDITALGSPVNFLSRLDEITKNPKISSLLKSSDVVLSENTYKLLIEHGVNIDARLIDLCAMGVEIRNFSTEKRVYCLTASEHNCQVVRIALTTDSTCPTQTDEHRFKAA